MVVAPGLGNYVEALFKKGGAEFNVSLMCSCFQIFKIRNIDSDPMCYLGDHRIEQPLQSDHFSRSLRVLLII